jgi:hypothetical protein
MVGMGLEGFLPQSRKGRKGAQGSVGKMVNEAFDAIRQTDGVEIDEEAQVIVRHPKIGEELG